MEDRNVRHINTAGGVIKNARGEIAVVSQGGISWSLPKGGVEEGESLLEAAKREIYEETGLRGVTFLRELGVYDRYRTGLDGENDLRELKTITMFLFETEEEELNPIDPTNPEARWVEVEEVASLLTHPKDKAFFLSVKDSLDL